MPSKGPYLNQHHAEPFTAQPIFGVAIPMAAWAPDPYLAKPEHGAGLLGDSGNGTARRS
jgi:hypothetical protein